MQDWNLTPSGIPDPNQDSSIPPDPQQNLNRDALRPATMLELLDKTFRVYRENFLTFVGLVAAVTVPVTIVNIVSSFWMTKQYAALGLDLRSSTSAASMNTSQLGQLYTGIFGALAVVLAISLIAAFIQAVFINGPLAYIASEYNLGRRVSVGQAFSAIRDRFGTLAGGLILAYVIIIVMSVALAFTFFLCGFGLGIIAYVGIVLFSFLVPVLVLERVGITDGMSRAWSLAKSRFWPVLGLTLSVQVIAFVLGLALGVVNQLLVRGTVAPASFGASQILQIVFTALISIFVQPILPIGYTLMYYDARVRFEGLGYALPSVKSTEPRPSDLASPPPPGGTFNRDDLINMAILCVIGFILILLYFAGVSALMGSLGLLGRR